MLCTIVVLLYAVPAGSPTQEMSDVGGGDLYVLGFEYGFGKESAYRYYSANSIA